MLDLKFLHFEGFGGAIVNNLVGFLSNGFTALTHATLTDPIALMTLAAMLVLGLMVYAIVKGDFDQIYTLMMGDKVYDNVIVRLIALYIVFAALLQPIPVVQMTPIVGYEQEQSGAGVNAGDRVVVGWAVNDLKTTAQITSVAQIDSGVPKQEMASIPLIFLPLSWLQEFYYGFPDFDVNEIAVTGEESGNDEIKERNVAFAYKVPDSDNVPVLSACLKDSDVRAKYAALENSIYARLDLGEFENLSSNCKTNYGPNGVWRKDVEESFVSTLFGYQTVYEILSDYFEPIDRIFYYMTMEPMDDVLINYRNIANNAINAQELQNLLVQNWEENKWDFYSAQTNKLYQLDMEIEKNIKSSIEILKELKKIEQGKSYPKEIIAALQDQIINYRAITQPWRRNLASLGDEQRAAESKAIPKVSDNSVTGDAKTKTGERRSVAMVSFMMIVVDLFPTA